MKHTIKIIKSIILAKAITYIGTKYTIKNHQKYHTGKS